MEPQADPDAGARGEDRPEARSAARWPVVCWIVILVLIGVVQVVRALWFDTAVFFAAAVLVSASRWSPQRARFRLPLRWTALGAVAFGVALCAAPRHSGWMAATVLLVGAAALALTWSVGSAPGRAWPAGLRRLGIAWAAVFIAGCLWELLQFILGRIAPDRPSYALSDLVDPLLALPLGKAVFVAAWLACGVYLLRRGGSR